MVILTPSLAKIIFPSCCITIVSLSKIKLLDKSSVIDIHTYDIGSVYPGYYIGHELELNRINGKLGSHRNLYQTGSLADYAYSDQQVLTAKSIDLARELQTLSTDTKSEIVKSKAVVPLLSTVTLTSLFHRDALLFALLLVLFKRLLGHQVRGLLVVPLVQVALHVALQHLVEPLGLLARRGPLGVGVRGQGHPSLAPVPGLGTGRVRGAAARAHTCGHGALLVRGCGTPGLGLSRSDGPGVVGLPGVGKGAQTVETAQWLWRRFERRLLLRLRRVRLVRERRV